MNEPRTREILDRIKETQIAVYGDFCLDAYWMLDPAGSEVSVETGLQAQAVKRHYYSLGGASNVVANLAAGSVSVRDGQVVCHGGELVRCGF